MKSKFNKEDLYKMHPIDVYNLVLEKKHIKIFPKGFWQRPEAIENSKIITKYLIEEKLKLSDEELLNQLSAKTFKENGLGGMLNTCFKNSPFEALNSTYPNKFKEWEFSAVPRSFWTKENGIIAIKWLVEEKLKLSDKEILSKASQKMFQNNRLGGMLDTYFKNSPFEAINSAYPNKFKEWEFSATPQGFWTLENGIKVTKWLIEEKLKLSDEEILNQLSTKLFKENKLGGMLDICFRGSPFEAINSAYPNKFKEWEFSTTPQGFWTLENSIKATKWLIEEKLQLSDDEILNQLSSKLFLDNKLGGMLYNCFKNSPFEAINSACPNKFKQWEFSNVPVGFWTKESSISATKWLIEKKLQLSDEEISKQLSQKIFLDNGLGGMLRNCFKNSPFEAINSAYPNKFKRSEFKNYNN